MDPTQPSGSGSPTGDERPFLDPLDDFLVDRSKGEGTDSGTYRRNLARDVRRFSEWFCDRFGRRPTFGELDDGHFRRYARSLRDGRLDSMHTDQPARGTVLTYYANVSAYVGWCVGEGYLDEHLAQTDRAVDPLPEDDGRRSGDQQAWTPEQRRRLLSHVDGRVSDVLDGDASPRELLKVSRDRALVYVVAYSGVRGAEILRHPEDDRRDGLRWRDVDLEDMRMTVLSKSHRESWSDRSLPPQSRNVLARYRKRLAPPTDDWPVFPTLHLPTLASCARDALADSGLTDAEIQTRLDASPTLDVVREVGCTPPALTTNGARRVMERLTAAADIQVDDDHGYLTLHGARRGAGEVMVRERGHAAAARLLDNTERMVRERYSHIEAGELAEDVGDAFAARDESH